MISLPGSSCGSPELKPPALNPPPTPCAGSLAAQTQIPTGLGATNHPTQAHDTTHQTSERSTRSSNGNSSSSSSGGGGQNEQAIHLSMLVSGQKKRKKVGVVLSPLSVCNVQCLHVCSIILHFISSSDTCSLHDAECTLFRRVCV